MTKTPNNTTIINRNRDKITKLLSGIGTVKRLNNLNWLRHEISYVEPQTLFRPPSGTNPEELFDFTSIKNLGPVYDYIIEPNNYALDTFEISKIHSMLCAGTFIPGGQLRNAPVVLDIMVNGGRMHAPDAYEIQYCLNEIIYNLNNGRESALSKAFDLHYELVVLQPFTDFNKRTARFCMDKYLVQNGYRPIAFNHPDDTTAYVNAIAARANGDKKTYTRYMQNCMIRTQQAIIAKLTKSHFM